MGQLGQFQTKYLISYSTVDAKSFYYSMVPLG